MKFTEYSGKYTNFQTGVLKKYLEKDFSKEETEKYMDLYLEWKTLALNEKDKKLIAEAAEKSKELIEIESNYSYEKIAAAR